jgi:hypothetical protein
MEEFQQFHGRAITRQRHVKSGSVQHTKDDRDRVANPRHFVLGWDNREKCRRLAEEAEQLRGEVARLDQRIQRLDALLEELRVREAAIRQALRVADFASIDFMSHDLEIAALKLEKQKLEEGNQKIDHASARRRALAQQGHRCSPLVRLRRPGNRGRHRRGTKLLRRQYRAILSSLRLLFPQTKSFLMDDRALRQWSELATEGAGNQPDPPQLLVSEERKAFLQCRAANLRIEQERIPQPAVRQALAVVQE